MGVFDRKTEISVTSVVYAMGEDPDKIPDVIAAGAITAALRGMPVPRAIRDSVFEGMGIKLSQAYSYAKGKYYAGMPKGFPKEHATKRDAVLDLLCQEYLESLWPSDVITLQTTETSFEDDYVTKMKELVAAEYNHDFFLGRTLSATGSVQTGASLEVSGPFHNTVDHPDQVGYTLTFTNPDASVVAIDEWYAATLFISYERIVRRVIMEFSKNGGRSIQESYEYGGTSARLNIYLGDLEHEMSGTFPAIVLKNYNKYLDTDEFSDPPQPWKNSPAYKTSKQYGKRLGINVDTMLKLVKDNESEADIDHCFIQPGIRLNSPNKPVLKYLFNYFNRIRLLYPDNKEMYDLWFSQAMAGNVSKNLASGVPAQSLRLADPDNPLSSIDMEIAWRWMTYEVKTGTVDEYERITGPKQGVGVRYDYGGDTKIAIYDTSMLYLRKQLTDTTYGEIAICGMTHRNYIYKGNAISNWAWTAINDPTRDDGEGFIIPLDYTIYITLSPRERLQLGQECMHIVFNCYVARKQKWYETGWFKIVLAFIAVVIIAFSWGTATPYVTSLYTSIYAGVITVIGVATIAAAIAALLVAIVLVAIAVTVQFLAKEAGEWAAEKWGPAWGAVVQIVAVIALTWGAGAIGVGPGLAFGAATLAEQVLMVGSALLAGMSAYTEYTYVAVQDQIKTWQSYANTADNPLEKVNELMAEMFPELTEIQKSVAMPKPENLDEFLGRSLTTVDGLTNKLFLPIESMADLTLTPRL